MTLQHVHSRKCRATYKHIWQNRIMLARMCRSRFFCEEVSDNFENVIDCTDNNLGEKKKTVFSLAYTSKCTLQLTWNEMEL